MKCKNCGHELEGEFDPDKPPYQHLQKRISKYVCWISVKCSCGCEKPEPE